MNVPTPFESKKKIKANEFSVMVSEESEINLIGRSYLELNEAYPDA